MPETYRINARDYSALLKVADDAETHIGNLIHKREACDQDVARNSNWENSFSMLVQPVRLKIQRSDGWHQFRFARKAIDFDMFNPSLKISHSRAAGAIA